jgi:hypothetical protein
MEFGRSAYTDRRFVINQVSFVRSFTTTGATRAGVIAAILHGMATSSITKAIDHSVSRN